MQTFSIFAETLKAKNLEKSFCFADGHTIPPKAIHSYSTRVIYEARSKGKPLAVRFVVAGIDHKEPYLGTVDIYGTPIVKDFIATGLGEHMVKPLMAKKQPELMTMTGDQAKAFLMECMAILFMRHTAACPECKLVTMHYDAEHDATVVDPVEILTVDTTGCWHSPVTIKLPI